MKFHATVVFKFSARDIGEAGKRLNDLLLKAEESARNQVTRAFHAIGTPVTLPPVAPPMRT